MHVKIPYQCTTRQKLLSAILTGIVLLKTRAEMRCRPGVVENAQITELTHEGGRAVDCSTATETFFYPLSLMRHLYTCSRSTVTWDMDNETCWPLKYRNFWHVIFTRLPTIRCTQWKTTSAYWKGSTKTDNKARDTRANIDDPSCRPVNVGRQCWPVCDHAV